MDHSTSRVTGLAPSQEKPQGQDQNQPEQQEIDLREPSSRGERTRKKKYAVLPKAVAEDAPLEDVFAYYTDYYFYQAEQLCQKFWRLIDQGNKSGKHSRWSNISCRTYRKDDNVYIEWHRTTFKKGDESKKAFLFHIPKTRGDKYHISSLKRFCVGWETDLVSEFEIQFRPLRRIFAALAKQRIATREALRLCKEGEM